MTAALAKLATKTQFSASCMAMAMPVMKYLVRKINLGSIMESEI